MRYWYPAFDRRLACRRRQRTAHRVDCAFDVDGDQVGVHVGGEADRDDRQPLARRGGQRFDVVDGRNRIFNRPGDLCFDRGRVSPRIGGGNDSRSLRDVRDDRDAQREVGAQAEDRQRDRNQFDTERIAQRKFGQSTW